MQPKPKLEGDIGLMKLSVESVPLLQPDTGCIIRSNKYAIKITPMISNLGSFMQRELDAVVFTEGLTYIKVKHQSAMQLK